MVQRGRKSAASLSVVAQDCPTGMQRLAPLSTLTDAEKVIWVQVVNDNPAEVFTDTLAPLLELYCGHILKARILRKEILRFDPAWLSDDDGLNRYDKLLKMAERESRAASSLATRLRITRQAIDHKTASRAQANAFTGDKPWQVDE